MSLVNAKDQYLYLDTSIPDTVNDDFLNNLDNLCMLEASYFKRKVDASLQQWDMVKKYAEEALDIKTPNRNIYKANLEEEFGIDLSSEEKFNEVYEQKRNILTQLSDKLLEVIDRDIEKSDSSMFMTDQMIHITNQYIKYIEDHPEMVNFNDRLKTQKAICTAFNYHKNDPGKNLNRLMKKLEQFLKTHHRSIVRKLKSDKIFLDNNKSTKIIRILIREFSSETLAKAYDTLREYFKYDKLAMYIFSIFASYLIEFKGLEASIFIKLFIVDLCDIYNNIYDITDISLIRTYATKMRSMIREYIKRNNISEINNNTFFGLPEYEKHKKTEEE